MVSRDRGARWVGALGGVLPALLKCNGIKKESGGKKSINFTHHSTSNN